MGSAARAILYVSIASICYGLQPVFIKAMVPFFSITEQTLLRFTGGLIVFGTIALLEEKELKEEAKRWMHFVPAGLIYGFAVVCWIIGNYLVMDAITTGILSRVNIIFIAVISSLLFADEKRLLLSRRFFTGMVLAAIGAIGVIASKGTITFELGVGAGFIMLAHLLGSFYSADLKSLANHKESATSLSIIFASSFLVAAAFFFIRGGEVGNLVQPIMLIPIISGVTGLGIGNYFAFKSIEEQGLVATTSMLLATPLVTAVISFVFIAEELVALQLFWAMVLIAGCYLIINAEFGPLHLGRGIKKEFKKALAHL
ncbi:MAG: DMT family transporter [Candidatus Diapherotrites archaeon]|nr:DMT family transporter [Candidatus Diapherotrites archaeon]